MEKRVIIRERQEITADDYASFGDYPKQSFDHIVADGIQDTSGWALFQALKSGTAEVTIKPGRLYNAGMVYALEADQTFEFINDLPTTNKTWVAIVGYGQEIDTDVEPRDFLIDVATGVTEPNAVALLRQRKANIAEIVGVEAPQPAKPVIPNGNILIAWVMLSPTGVDSVALVEENRVAQVARERGRINALSNRLDTVFPLIEALASLVASLQAQLAGVGQQRSLDNLYIDLARVKEHLELEDGYTDYDADRFLDTEESDTDNVAFLAKVREGVRFSDDAANTVAMTVFNPLNPDVVVSNNMLLPKFTEVKRLHVQPFYEQLQISQYSYQEFDMVQRSVSRTRIRYGEETTVCTNASWYKKGNYDSASKVFTKDGESWEYMETVKDRSGTAHDIVRLRRFWVDTYTEHYWDRVTTEHTISGQQIAQTFLNAGDGWLSSIGLFFTQKGNTGNVDVALCEVAYGMPDVKAVLNKVTLNVANIVTSADGTLETKVTFPATFLEAGKRYAIVITTGGNHYVAMANGTQYAQGTFFYSVDGAYQMGTAQRDLMFSLYFAKFNKTRTVVDLAAMSLSGGITDIDILAPMLLPDSCEIVFEVQVAGVWHPLASVISGNTVLYGLPPLLPFRAVFNGTSDVQAGINLLDSQLSYSRPRTTFKHISEDYTLASASDDFKVVVILENYKEANHNLTCTIKRNGGGSELNPATTVDEPLDNPEDARSADHKRIKRTFTWTSVQITSPMTSVDITLNGSTSSALDTFHVAERVHLAF